jgi:pimeloyl-ACP methyl ester carboxylesterase
MNSQFTRRALMLSILGASMDSFTETKPSRTATGVRSNGLTFPILTWGAEGGRPILLLHGFPQEPSTWASVAAALAQDGFHAVAPVQRGYAASARPLGPGAYTFMQFIEDAIGIADALGLKNFDLAGFGIGAAQAWMLTAYYPARIRSLTAFRYPHPAAFARGMESDLEQKGKWFQLQQELGAGNPDEKAIAMLANDAAGLRRFLTASGLPEPFLDRYVSRLKEPGALVAALYWNLAVSLEEFAKVPAVTTPTLYVWSDGPALARTTAETTRNYVRARFTEVSIPNAGHFMLETSPADAIAPLRRHLEST